VLAKRAGDRHQQFSVNDFSCLGGPDLIGATKERFGVSKDRLDKEL